MKEKVNIMQTSKFITANQFASVIKRGVAIVFRQIFMTHIQGCS
jgi:hypothetical protein